MTKLTLTCTLLLVTLACGVMTPVPSNTPTDTPTSQQETPSATETPSPTIYTVLGNWNIRDGASEQSTKRGELRDGAMVTIRLCRPDGWCRLDNGYYLCGRAVGLAEACE